jgi:hypothetical protein
MSTWVTGVLAFVALAGFDFLRRRRAKARHAWELSPIDGTGVASFSRK